jgi:hypothetical protein
MESGVNRVSGSHGRIEGKPSQASIDRDLLSTVDQARSIAGNLSDISENYVRCLTRGEIKQSVSEMRDPKTAKAAKNVFGNRRAVTELSRYKSTSR